MQIFELYCSTSPRANPTGLAEDYLLGIPSQWNFTLEISNICIKLRLRHTCKPAVEEKW